MYQYLDSDKKVGMVIDEFNTTVNSSLDSRPQTLTGTSTAANLILLYSFSKDECGEITSLTTFPSSGEKWTLCMCLDTCVCIP